MENLFNKAMKEYNQTKPSKSEICDHEYTIKSSGWEICVTCGLRLRQILSQDLSSYSDRYFFNNIKKDHVVEIREKMSELMGMIVRKTRIDVRDLRVDQKTGEIYDTGPPEGDLPRELFDYSKELCQVCYDYKLPDGPIHCQTCSLCAAVLWEKVKSLYPMSMDEFRRRVGVSKLTITNTCKKMRNKYQLFLNSLSTGGTKMRRICRIIFAGLYCRFCACYQGENTTIGFSVSWSTDISYFYLYRMQCK